MAPAATVETAAPVAKLSVVTIDALVDEREALKAKVDAINDKLKAQVETHGYTPAGAEKSKRIDGTKWQLTVSTGSTTEIRDAGVAAIEKSCPSDLFSKLFRRETKYKLVDGATMLLAGKLPAGAPSNLRKLFAAAVVVKTRAASLSVKLLGDE